MNGRTLAHPFISLKFRKFTSISQVKILHPRISRRKVEGLKSVNLTHFMEMYFLSSHYYPLWILYSINIYNHCWTNFPPKSANYLGFGQSAFIHCQSLSSNSQFIVPQGAPLLFPSMVVTLLFCWIISFGILSDQ